MAIYNFYCQVCGLEKEVIQKVNDDPPMCDHNSNSQPAIQMTKKITTTSFILKGNGWAKDAYGGNKK